MKRIGFLFLLIFIVGMIFAGGNRGGQSSAAAASVGKKYSNIPFVNDGKTKFTMLIRLAMANINSYDYNDNSYTKEIVDATGVQLDFIAVPTADFNTRKNLLFASGDYPDILNISYNTNFSEMAYLASEGIIIPLDDYNYFEYPLIAKAFNEYPALNTVLRLGDGKVYALPYMDDAMWSTYQYGRGWFHMPWIRDHRQMRYPTTLDELTAYLKWIRDTDVNGNGRNDEIPLVYRNVRQSTAFFAKSFMPFVFNSTFFGLALVNGRVTEQYRLNEYRETLKYMAMLYGEKLIKEDAYTLSADQLRALLLNPEPIVGMFIEGYAHTAIGNSADTPRWVETFNLPVMNGPGGRHWSTNREPWGICRQAWYVTNKCRDPELVIALYDYMTKTENYLNGKNQKGKSWDNPDPGTVGLDGRPAVYKRLVQEIQMPLNSLWYVDNAMLNYGDNRLGEQTVGMDSINRWLSTGDPSLRDTVLRSPSFLLGGLIHWTRQDEKNAIPASYFIPPTILSDADSKRVSDIIAVLDPYIDQSIAEFVTGVRNINNDTAWNAYLADLDRIGSQEMAVIYQKHQK